jgi:predicted DNA-binding protein
MRLEHRLQILIDDERHERLLTAARERGVSVATIVREAIDRGLPAADDRRRAAAQRVLDAPTIPALELDALLLERWEPPRLG